MGVDDLNLEQFRLPQNFSALTGVKKILTTVPIRKPHPHEFFRVHNSWSFPASVLKLRGDRREELFVVASHLVAEVPMPLTPMVFVPAITRQVVVMLWPVRLPDETGRQDEWARTAFEAMTRAQTCWIRMAAKQALGGYEIFEAPGQMDEPKWPDVTFEQILQIAIKDRVIQDREHAELRKLRGEVG